MTTAHVEKFAELVGKDPALLAKLGLDKANAAAAAASASMAAYITNAVKEAKTLGFSFTAQELTEFIAAQAKAAETGEMTDTQLEAVAGGGGRRTSPTSVVPPSLIPQVGSAEATRPAPTGIQEPTATNEMRGGVPW
jgi:hypothetical protein